MAFAATSRVKVEQSSGGKSRIKPSVRILGYALFVVWGAVLSGLFEQTFSSPGVLQALELKGLLEQKQAQVANLEGELRGLEDQIRLLEKNDIAIEREIRRTLGYAAADELVFDFTASGRKAPQNLDIPPSEAPALGARGRVQDSQGQPGAARAGQASPEGAGGRLSITPALKRFFLPVAAAPNEDAGQEL